MTTEHKNKVSYRYGACFQCKYTIRIHYLKINENIEKPTFIN